MLRWRIRGPQAYLDYGEVPVAAAASGLPPTMVSVVLMRSSCSATTKKEIIIIHDVVHPKRRTIDQSRENCNLMSATSRR